MLGVLLLFLRQESCGKDINSIKADGLLNTVPVLSTEVSLVTEKDIPHASPNNGNGTQANEQMEADEKTYSHSQLHLEQLAKALAWHLRYPTDCLLPVSLPSSPYSASELCNLSQQAYF